MARQKRWGSFPSVLLHAGTGQLRNVIGRAAPQTVHFAWRNAFALSEAAHQSPAV